MPFWKKLIPDHQTTCIEIGIMGNSSSLSQEMTVKLCLLTDCKQKHQENENTHTVITTTERKK